MIEGVVISDRPQIVDERGKIMYMLRVDDPEFLHFGEVYFSWVNPGAVKGWHLHREMTLNYVCPHGQIKLVPANHGVPAAHRGQLSNQDSNRTPQARIRREISGHPGDLRLSILTGAFVSLLSQIDGLPKPNTALLMAK